MKTTKVQRILNDIDRSEASETKTPTRVDAVQAGWKHSNIVKLATGLLALLLIGVSAWVVEGFVKGDTPANASDPMMIDTQNGKTFRYQLKVGDSYPTYSPYSHANTAVKAEPCFWNTDGTAKTDPTWVALNADLGKPGPTFCPDCGRLVVGHNPAPAPGMRPPPTQQELLQKRRSSATAE